MIQSNFAYDSPQCLTKWARAKRRLKQALPGDLRRIHVYNVGLERTGTHYIAQLFSKYRAWHEPDISRLLPFIVNGESPSTEWFRSRDRALRLEVESSHVVGQFVDRLTKIFPESKFICTAREPVSWVRSVWRWSYPDEPGTRVRTRPNPSKSWKMWHSILKAYYDGYEYQSETLKECGLYSMKGYFSKYKSHYRNILESVPSDRLLVVCTSSLSEETRRIAGFLNVKESMLTPPSKNVNQSDSQKSPFANLSDEYIESVVEDYCSDIWGRLLERSKR